MSISGFREYFKDVLKKASKGKDVDAEIDRIEYAIRAYVDQKTEELERKVRDLERKL